LSMAHMYQEEAGGGRGTELAERSEKVLGVRGR
jgi:hypothetical protein